MMNDSDNTSTRAIPVEEKDIPSRHLSLQRNIILLVIGVSLAPLFFISGVLFYSYHIVYTEKTIAHIQELVERKKGEIDLFLSDNAKVIAMQAESYDYDTLSSEAFLQARLKKLRNIYSTCFVDLGVVNTSGTQVAYAGPYHLSDASYSDADWFKKALLKDSFISDVFSGIRGVPHFIVTVRGKHGGQPWLLRSTVDFAAFNTLVRDVQLGTTGLAFIINREGEFQTDLRPGESINLAALKNLLSLDYKNGHPKYLEKEDSNGVDYLYIATTLKNGEWILVYQQKTDDALLHLYTARRIALLILVIGGTGIVVTAVYLTRRTVRRLDQFEYKQDVMEKQVLETSKLAAIGELAAGIAHEINNPVAIMIEEAGWVEDLLAEERKEELKNFEEISHALAEIAVQGRRCKDITHKLLSFARRTDPRQVDVDINEMVEEVVGLTTQRARYQNVTLETTLEEDLPKVCIAPTELQQIILNLVNNAIDANDKEAGSVLISTRLTKDFVILEVRDDGSGIPPAILDRIFEPFFTTKPVGKGTGLGLSICYGIVNKLGGDIIVHNETGAGATFEVRLPFKHCHTEEPEQEQEQASA